MIVTMDSTITSTVISESDNNSVFFSAILSHPTMSRCLHSLMQTMQDGPLARLAKQACAECCKVRNVWEKKSRIVPPCKEEESCKLALAKTDG